MCEDKFSAVSMTPSVQWEHMILITEEGNEVITQRKNEELKIDPGSVPPNEISIQTIKEGDNVNFAKARQEVEVHYVGSLLDGTEFDSSVRRG